jgi:hypothetical protein
MTPQINENIYKFYFKIPYTELNHRIRFIPELTVTQFIELIDSNFIRVYFDIHHDYRVEVVEAGNNENGNDEMAPALQPSEQTLEEKYGENYNFIAFYIRPVYGENRQFVRNIDYSISPTQQNTNQQNTNQQNTNINEYHQT